MPANRSGLTPSVQILAVALVGHVVLSVALTGSKTELGHDEAISYLAATAHEGEYAELERSKPPPYGLWRPAREWQRFIQPDARFAFGQIAHDLAYYDIHPPLYFWILHLACLASGPSLWLGTAVNVVLNLAGIAVVFALARYIFANSRLAALSALLWAFSPAVLQSTTIARQYALLGILTAGLVFCALPLLDPRKIPERRDAVRLGVVTVLIMLTHYQAIVPVAGLACFAAWFWWRKDRHRAIHIMGALIAAAIVVLAAHPQFFRSFGRYGAQFRGGPSWSERLQIVTPAPSFFFARRPDGRIAATAAAGSLVVVAAAFRRFRGRNPAELSWGDPALRATCLVMIWTSAGLVGLYLFRFSPGHAFAPQYLSMIYPLMAVIVVAALNRMPWALAGLVGLMIWDVAAVARWEAPSIGAHRRIDMADRLVIDKPARGVALPIVARLPADKMVFVAHSQDLIAAPAPWLDPLTTRSAWVSDSRYSRSADERTRIRRLLKRKFDIVEAHTVGERTVFELKEPAVAPADVRP